jgi:hypothetical protein
MSPQKSPPIPTAAQAIASIATWTQVSEASRKTFATAVRTYCRFGGKKAPETVRLDPTHCLTAIDQASPAALGKSGISQKAHRNDLTP